MSKPPILYVEDDEHDVFFLKRAFDAAAISNPLQVVHDGQAAIDYLSGTGEFAGPERPPLPCLILLDLKLPRRDGLEVLQWLRHESGLPSLPVILFSSSGHDEDVERAYQLGANSFVVKPSDLQARKEFAQAVKDYWLRFHEPSPLLRNDGLGFGMATGVG